MAVLLEPGKGQYREAPPVTEHSRYPLHMEHPGFQPGIPDREIKVVDPATGRPTGQLIYTGSQPIRYAPVLVFDSDQEEGHAAQGYRPVGKSDPAAFAKAVATAAPPVLDYKPIEYPKWVFGKMVNDVAEEEARYIELNINKDGSPRVVSSELNPAEIKVDVEVNSLEVFPPSEEDEIAALEAKLAALKAKKAPTIVDTYAERMNPPGADTTTDVMIARGANVGVVDAPSLPLSGEVSVATLPALTKSEKIKAAWVKRKADAAAAALTAEVSAEASQD